MGALAVVELHVAVQIGLQLIDTFVEGFAERDRKELLLEGTLEALAEAAGLRGTALGASMPNLVDGEVEFKGMVEVPPAKFSPVVAVSRCSTTIPCSS